jgi:hypothetical protein
MRGNTDFTIGIDAVECNPPRGRTQQPCDHPQQGRLACAVRAGHEQRLASRHLKAQPLEQPTAAPDARKFLREKPHQDLAPAACASGRRKASAVSHLIGTPGIERTSAPEIRRRDRGFDSLYKSAFAYRVG